MRKHRKTLIAAVSAGVALDPALMKAARICLVDRGLRQRRHSAVGQQGWNLRALAVMNEYGAGQNDAEYSV